MSGAGSGPEDGLGPEGGSGPEGDLHGRPTASELLDATLVFLRDQLSPHLDETMRHPVRIAAHALEIVAREMTFGPDQEAAHRGRLAELGFSTDAALAGAIKDGSLTDSPLLRRLLTEDSRDRLLVANPRWLPDEPPA